MKKAIFLLILGAVVVTAAIFVYPRLSTPPASTERPAEQAEVQRGDLASFRKPSEEALRKQLTELQYDVTQEDATERAFTNEYWNNKAEGIYVDIVSGAPLFSSKDKYESGTGWPSFTRSLGKDEIVEKVDRKLLATRTEVRSKTADSHLGHVFDDGPQPSGQRFCINSGALELESHDVD